MISKPKSSKERVRESSVEGASSESESASGEALPAGWATANVEEIADIKLGKMLDRGKAANGVPLPYLRNINVRWRDFDLEELLEMPFSDEEADKFTLLDGDVIVCEGGEPGRAAVWNRGPTDIKYQKALHRVRLAEDLNPHWLVHRLEHDAFTEALSEHFTGTTIKHFTRKAFAKYPIPIPPLAEQTRIVSAIESLQERSSRARDLLSEVGPLIGQLRQSVLRAAFSGRLTADWREQNPDVEPASELLSKVHEHDDGTKKRRRIKKKGTVPLHDDLFHDLPESWAYATVDECLEKGFIIDYVDGNHGGLYPRKEEFGDEGIQFITAKQINDGIVDFDSAPRLNEERAQQLQKGWARGGDVLLTHNATVGRVARTPEDVGAFLLGTSVTYYRCNQAVFNCDFLYHVFCAPQWQAQLGSIMEQTTRNQVSIQKQGFFRIPIAPVEEQREIVRILDLKMERLRHVESGLASMESSLTQLDQSILSKAFRGELVSQDPSDEPASQLLARIREKRQATSNKRR